MDESQITLIASCRGLEQDVFRARQAITIYDWMADHAEEVRAASHGLSFGIVQQLCVTELFAAFGRLYDSDGFGQKPISIKLAISQLPKTRNLDAVALIEFISWAAPRTRLGDIPTDAILERSFAAIRKSYPTEANCPQLRRLLETRHTEIAHRAQQPSIERAKWDDAYWCLDWAERFTQMLRKGLRSPVPHMSIADSLWAFQRLAHSASAVLDPRLTAHEEAMSRLSQRP